VELKAGYKNTDIGAIPANWDCVAVGELGTVGSGGTPSREVPRFWNGTIPWVTTSQVDFNEINEADQFITADGLRNSAAKLLSAGTLLLALYGQGKTRGKVAILGVEATTNQACASIACNERVLAAYLFHFLASRYDALRNVSNGGSQDNLSGQLVKAFRVALPPRDEQRAIAVALSDVDALIAALDRLIAKKRDLKQAAMQQLLTGQTRLPGFDGEWKAKQLSAVCAMKSGESITSASIDVSSPYPCYGGNGHRGFTSRFTHDGTHALIGRQGALCGNVVLAEGQFFASEHAVVVAPSADVDVRWLAAVLRCMNLNQYSESSAQPGLSVSKLLMLEVLVPPSREEQTATAAVLSDLDAELTALEARRDKTRLLKQGMMQELLTGRTRLV
jgi:type I restriction enzyme, S subunit